MNAHFTFSCISVLATSFSFSPHFSHQDSSPNSLIFQTLRLGLVLPPHVSCHRAHSHFIVWIQLYCIFSLLFWFFPLTLLLNSFMSRGKSSPASSYIPIAFCLFFTKPMFSKFDTYVFAWIINFQSLGLNFVKTRTHVFYFHFISVFSRIFDIYSWSNKKCYSDLIGRLGVEFIFSTYLMIITCRFQL